MNSHRFSQSRLASLVLLGLAPAAESWMNARAGVGLGRFAAPTTVHSSPATVVMSSSPTRPNTDATPWETLSAPTVTTMTPAAAAAAAVAPASSASKPQRKAAKKKASSKKASASSSTTTTTANAPRSLKHMASESVAWTLKRMAESPLLTAEQELVLGRYTQRLSVFEATRTELKASLGRDPTMEEWATASNYTAARTRAGTDAEALEAFNNHMAKGRRAKERLVNSNMRLVVSIARRYQNLGVGLQDLIQEGCLGLIRAAEKYDPSRGFRFSTYASWWIQQAVFRAVAFQSRIIRLPMHIHNLLNRVRNTRKDMFMETGVIPTDDELAGRLGVSIDKLRLVLASSRRTYSSSAPLKMRRKRGGSTGFVDSDASFEQSSSSNGGGAPVAAASAGTARSPSGDMLPEEFVEGLLFRSEIHDVLDVLDDDERFVVTLRYGLGVPRRLSMGEIAEMAGTGKVWVKKMEQRALRKLRRPHHQMKLRPFSIDKSQLDGAVDDLSRTMAYRNKWRDSPPEEFLALQNNGDGAASVDAQSEL